MTKCFKKIKLQQKKIGVLKIINIFLLLIIISQFINFVYDEIKLNNYINDNFSTYKSKGKLEYEDILDVRNFILYDIDYNSPSIQFERPKIGWSVGTIIRKKQGLCGEGARLLYHIYKKFGIDSRRVIIYNNHIFHVILEVKYEDKWILMESIKNYEGEYFKNLLDSAKSPILYFFKIGPKGYSIIPDSSNKRWGYTNFSYLPLNGIFNNFYTKTEIYVHQPLCPLINYILESPPLFYLIILSLIMLLVNFRKIINTFRILFRQKKIKTQ